MAQVTLTVNNQSFDVACQDGEESRLQDLATYIDGKMSSLSAALGQVADTRLFLMTTLVLTDELFESREKVRAKTGADDETTLIRTLDGVARKIEDIAERLEGA